MAREPARSKTRTKQGKRQSRTPGRAAKTTLFHGPSFFTGIGVGVAATVVGALLPGWWDASAIKQPESGAVTEQQSAPAETQFEFWDELPRDRVTTNTDVYRDATPTESPERIEYLVQAGSFEQLADANRLRASLLLLGLDTNTRTVSLDSGAIWHRVLVGPFDSERDTRRAITRLREQRIEPLLLKRPLPNQADAG